MVSGVGGWNVISFARVVFRLELIVLSELGSAWLPPMATSNSILFTDCSRYHS